MRDVVEEVFVQRRCAVQDNVLKEGVIGEESM